MFETVWLSKADKRQKNSQKNLGPAAKKAQKAKKNPKPPPQKTQKKLS
jgi:hypothetical protein